MACLHVRRYNLKLVLGSALTVRQAPCEGAAVGVMEAGVGAAIGVVGLRQDKNSGVSTESLTCHSIVESLL